MVTAMAGIDMGKDPLDDMLAGLARVHTAPWDDLEARVLADAVSVQAERAALQPPSRQMAGPSVWVRLVRAFGGGPATAGLGTAAIAGVLLGIWQPASVASMAAPVWETATEGTVDLLPDADDFLAEG